MVDTGDRTNSGKRKLFSLLCHGSIFLGSLLFTSAIPLVVLLLFDDPVIKATAKETLNYHFNIWLYFAISGALGFLFTALIVTIPLAWIIGLAFFLFHWIPPISGILATLSNPNEPYRYPFIWRVL
ncbi:DUF4870 domain-containing protein [Chamaesiphon minutus]|uniref:DUF4870 domain-containing protein n=1 Tax=Chamaesiphon minutus (strain ATCC 27169 / PCC 6605) TaxID=1173020 RepID=K9UMS4_CHAP6|nr:DUF4870 domain-containing protein [Chamaesiphon minutus]AFY95736.1 hypothetical protein Cha6605_4823 [Chamaesiphon minutus PCC 6605]